MASQVHLLGVRHHGPGCARSVVRALEVLNPDIVLVEGPSDAEELLPLAAHEGMQPPVALMIYATEDPSQAAFFPFAEYSPEWQAIQYSQRKTVPLRFIDLPQCHQMALNPKEKPQEGENAPGDADEAAASAPSEAPEEENVASPESEGEPEAEGEADADDPRHDPLGWLSRAAGYGDGEEWWEHMVEQRRDGDGLELFAAIAEAMTALRAESRPHPNVKEARREALREASMRKGIRAAQKEGKQCIAVICGAWHVPALADLKSVGADNDLLKNLPKIKVSTAWIPWTYDRLSFESGYGAGVVSPAWYEHLWRRNDVAGHAVISWFARVGKLLREQDLDCSSAHIIECVRLSETLAAMRERPLPGLGEMMESARAILSMGDDTALQLIRRELVLGHRMGQVPPESPAVPLQQDISKAQKSLRMKVTATSEPLELDLRKENDLARSLLLHRLRLLAVPWGELAKVQGGKGTFREAWRLQWKPEFALSIVEASPFGNSVPEAAAARGIKRGKDARDLKELTGLVDALLLADLPQALHVVMEELSNRAAITADLEQLMIAIPPLAQVLRYGNVRQTDTAQVGHVVDSLVTRVCIGLCGACQSVDDEAAERLVGVIQQVHGALGVLDQAELRVSWHAALRQTSAALSTHALISGLAVRLLFDEHAADADAVSHEMSRALSRGVEPEKAAAWLQGFLSGGGMVLVHDASLFGLVDEWVAGLNAEHFVQVLPLIRRTFALFPAMERRQIGERAKQGTSATPAATQDDTSWDMERLEKLKPTLRLIFGISTKLPSA